MKCACQHSWFTGRGWLHYDVSRDLVFCFTCVKAYQQNKLHSANIETAFIAKGYSNWKDGSVNLTKHETSNCYIVANEQMNILPATTPEVGEMLCAQAAKEKTSQSRMFVEAPLQC